MNEGGLSSSLGIAGRPALAETTVIARDIAVAESVGGRLHIPHVSTAGAVEIIAAAKSRGVAVTAEVTPHHLTLDESYCATYDACFRVNPPLRAERDVAALRDALTAGVIDVIATDHAPHPPETKEQPFEDAPPGMTGLETALAVLLTDLVEPGAIRIERLLDAMSWQPREILGSAVEGRGSEIEPGSPANLAVIDPACEWAVDLAQMASRSTNTPFAGRKLKGRVRHTLFRGEFVVRDYELVERAE